MLSKITNVVKGFNRLFWVTVIIPTAVASIYFGLIASAVYTSQSKFVIYSPQSPTPTAGGLSTLLSGAGLSSENYGVYAAQSYLQSRDALAALQRSLDIEAMYSGRATDWINRFGGLLYFRKTFENLYKYYGNMVGVDVDPTSNITTLNVDAYSPVDAQRINARLLEQAQQLIDRMNARADAEGVSFYSREVEADEAQVLAAATALARYRNQHRLFAPATQSELQLQLVAKLQSQLIQQETALAQMLVSTPRNPQIALLKKSIGATNAQIAARQAEIAGNSDSLATEAVPFEHLVLTRTFAEKKLAGAITALEEARIQAQKQQLFIETVVRPNRPDEALNPKRVRGVLATFVVGMMVWGVLSVVIGGVKEHHDR
ncbi:hypothetical protein GALL_316070 [mine drainage metagenome]|uniref:Chain length determinant protein n=1 Tax=mine drainage metagenome TaxID=410659 RepID=A0A1J5RA49_9ZZZZ